MSRRIATVVRIRELQERLAKAEVALAQGEVAAARSREDAAWAALRARQNLPAGRMDSTGLAARAAQLSGGVVAGVQAGVQVAAARTAADAAISRWTLAARDHDGVQRLAERIRVHEQAEADRREAVELDEIVVQRWPHREQVA